MLSLTLQAKGTSSVITAPIKEGEMQIKAEFIGTLYFSQSSTISTEIGGIVDKVYVVEGQSIKKGDPLVLLNSDLLQKNISSKEASLKQAKAIAQKNEQYFNKMQELYKNQSISQKEFDDVLYDKEAAIANTQSIAADLQSLLLERQKKTIRAPFSGVVLKRTAQEGAWINSGGAVLDLAIINPIEAHVNVPFNATQHIKNNMDVVATIQGKSYNGKVSAIIPQGDVKTRTFPIKVSFNNPNGELIEGLEVSLSLPLKDKQKGFLIPRDSLVPKNGGQIVFAVRDNKAQEISVKVLEYQQDLALVSTQELSINDQVVIKGNERLKNGVEVAHGYN